MTINDKTINAGQVVIDVPLGRQNLNPFRLTLTESKGSDDDDRSEKDSAIHICVCPIALLGVVLSG